MFRIVALAGLLLITGCNAHREPPQSMCDFPRSFATWKNTDVRWQGILLNATPHGMMILAVDCQKRGIAIERWPVAADMALGQVTRVLALYWIVSDHPNVRFPPKADIGDFPRQRAC